MRSPTFKGAFFCVLVGAIAAGVFACSSGTGLPGTIGVCPTTYDPIDKTTMVPTWAANKPPTHLSAGDPLTPTLPVGNYLYSSLNIFYYDATDDTRLGITEIPDGNGYYHLAMSCAYGPMISPDMAPISETIPFVMDIKVTATGIQVRRRTISFTIARPADPVTQAYLTLIQPIFDPTWYPASPKDTYTDDTAFTQVDQYLVDMNADASTQNYALYSFLQHPKAGSTGPNPPMVEVRIQVMLSGLTDQQLLIRDQQLQAENQQIEAQNPPAPAPSASPSPTK